MQGQLNRSPPLLRRASAVLVRYPPRAVGLAPSAAVGLLGAPADGHGELLFPAVIPPTHLSVRAGVIGPALPVWGLRQREGTPLGRVCSAAWFVRAVYSWSARSRGALISVLINNPTMVPTGGLGIEHAPAVPPSPALNHALHAIIVGHANDQKQRRENRDHRPDRHCVRMDRSSVSGEVAKAVLSPLFGTTGCPEEAAEHLEN